MLTNKTKQTTNTAKYLATLGSVVSVLYICSVLTFMLSYSLGQNSDSLLLKVATMIWFLVSWWGGWLIFAGGILFSARYKAQLQAARLPVTQAKVLLIVNVAGIVAVPVSFALVLIGWAATCSGSC